MKKIIKSETELIKTMEIIIKESIKIKQDAEKANSEILEKALKYIKNTLDNFETFFSLYINTFQVITSNNEKKILFSILEYAKFLEEENKIPLEDRKLSLLLTEISDKHMLLGYLEEISVRSVKIDAHITNIKNIEKKIQYYKNHYIKNLQNYELFNAKIQKDVDSIKVLNTDIKKHYLVYKVYYNMYNELTSVSEKSKNDLKTEKSRIEKLALEAKNYKYINEAEYNQELAIYKEKQEKAKEKEEIKELLELNTSKLDLDKKQQDIKEKFLLFDNNCQEIEKLLNSNQKTNKILHKFNKIIVFIDININSANTIMEKNKSLLDELTKELENLNNEYDSISNKYRTLCNNSKYMPESEKMAIKKDLSFVVENRGNMKSNIELLQEKHKQIEKNLNEKLILTSIEKNKEILRNLKDDMFFYYEEINENIEINENVEINEENESQGKYYLTIMVKLYTENIKKCNQKLETTKKDFNSKKQEYKDEIKDYEGEIKNYEVGVKYYQDKINSNIELIEATNLEISDYEKEINGSFNQKINEYKELINNLNQEINQHKESINVIEKNINLKSNQIKELEKDYLFIKKSYEMKEEEYNKEIISNKNKLKEITKKYDEDNAKFKQKYIETVKNLENYKSLTGDDLTELSIIIEKLNKDIDEFSTYLKDNQSTLDILLHSDEEPHNKHNEDVINNPDESNIKPLGEQLQEDIL